MNQGLQQLLEWSGPLGWLILLAGFLMQRKALMSVRVSTQIKGNQNKVNNQVEQTMSSGGGDDSRLARWGSWASIVGLALTLWPIVKPWLIATH